MTWQESPDYQEGMDTVALIAPEWMAHGPEGIGAWIGEHITNNPNHENDLFSVPLSTTPNSTVATHWACTLEMSQAFWDEQVPMEAAFSVDGNTELFYTFIPNSHADLDEVIALRSLYHLAS